MLVRWSGDLGIKARNNPPTRVPAPVSYPLLSLSIPAALRIEVRLSDSATPASRAKPREAIGCQVFVSTDASPPPDYAAWRYAGLATRDRITLEFDPADEMKKVSVIARWQMRKGQTGPWSQIRTMGIVGM
jgi:hypothetical protein